MQKSIIQFFIFVLSLICCSNAYAEVIASSPEDHTVVCSSDTHLVDGICCPLDQNYVVSGSCQKCSPSPACTAPQVKDANCDCVCPDCTAPKTEQDPATCACSCPACVSPRTVQDSATCACSCPTTPVCQSQKVKDPLSCNCVNCPAGKVNKGGICCKSFEHNSAGECCASGQDWVSISNKCCNSGSIVDGACCPGGQVNKGGICCASSQHNSAGNCCNLGKDWASMDNICCGSNQITDAGKCCPDNQVSTGGACQECPAPTHFSNGNCCNSGEDWASISGSCCSVTQLTDNGTCCASGDVPYGNSCITPPECHLSAIFGNSKTSEFKCIQYSIQPLCSTYNEKVGIDAITAHGVDGDIRMWCIFGTGTNLYYQGNDVVCACERIKGCFDPKSRISLIDGNTKEAKDISVKDVLLNPVTGDGLEVLAIIESTEKFALVEIGYGENLLKVSQTHPLPVEGGKLKKAIDLIIGDKVLGGDGQYHAIEKLQQLPIKDNQKVINFNLKTKSGEQNDNMILSDGIVTGDYYLQRLLAEQGK